MKAYRRDLKDGVRQEVGLGQQELGEKDTLLVTWHLRKEVAIVCYYSFKVVNYKYYDMKVILSKTR